MRSIFVAASISVSTYVATLPEASAWISNTENPDHRHMHYDLTWKIIHNPDIYFHVLGSKLRFKRLPEVCMGLKYTDWLLSSRVVFGLTLEVYLRGREDRIHAYCDE